MHHSSSDISDRLTKIQDVSFKTEHLIPPPAMNAEVPDSKSPAT